MEDVDALELLKEDLSQPIIETALESVRRLKTIGLALGEDQVLDRLLPYLADYAGIEDVEAISQHKEVSVVEKVVSDEILSEIANQLGEFVPLIGGASRCSPLLSLLAQLCLSPETCVRNSAVESFCKIIPILHSEDPAIASGLVFPIVKNMLLAEGFSPRCSVCKLTATLYSTLTKASDQAELLAIFLSLAAEDAPIIRRYAYESLGDVCLSVGVGTLKSELMGLVRKLPEETQENIRLISSDALVKLAKCTRGSLIDFKEVCSPLMDHLSNDASWRIRRSLSKALSDMGQFLPKEYAGSILAPLYAKLLKDNEPEVRLAATRNLESFVKNIDASSFGTVIAPQLEILGSDPVMSVKTALSEILLDLVWSAGRKTALEVLLPLILNMLDNDLADLRLNVLEKTTLLAESLGLEVVVNSILPKLKDLSTDPKWRVRKTVIESFTTLGKSLGVDHYNQFFKSVLLNGLKDPVYAVRDYSAQQLPCLVSEFGVEWVVTSLLPEALETNKDSKNYLHRMVPLLVIREVCESSLPAEFILDTIIPILMSFSKETVANVRIAVARIASKLSHCLDKQLMESNLRPLLNSLAKDDDGEVRYSASKALLSI